jgi:hypothetical protein
MGITGIGGFQQPYITPLSSGPSAAQRTDEAGPNDRMETVEENRRQQTQQAQQNQALQAQAGGGSTTPTRGQNLNITV